jgi:hypothetical protein
MPESWLRSNEGMSTARGWSLSTVGCTVCIVGGRQATALDQKARKQELTQITQTERKSTDYTERAYKRDESGICHGKAKYFLCNLWLFFLSV